MVDQKIEKENSDSTHVVESALSALWEKAREASYLISTLRDEKKKLQMKIDELEEDLAHTKNELLTKQSQLEQVRSEISENHASSSVMLANEEKQEIQQKIKSIISKLDQYISS